MRSCAQSITDSLEFCPDLAPAGHVAVQNFSQTRDSRRVPTVSASDFSARPRVAAHANHVNLIPKHSEKIDLISIMNTFAQAEPGIDQRLIESVYAIDGHQPADFAKLAYVEDGKEKLSTLLAERFSSKKLAWRDRPSQVWPSVSVPSRKRIRTNKVEHNELSALDLQLYQASQAQCVVEPSTKDAMSLLEHAQSLGDEIKQFKVQIDSSDHSLSWHQNFHIHSAPPALETFRAPAEAVRQLVKDRMFLLDDHCFEVKLGSVNSNAFATTSKDRLIQRAAEKMDISHILVSQEDITQAQVESIKAQALECALARHAEALTDAALEMVFQHCAQNTNTTTSNPTHKNKFTSTGSGITAPSKKSKAHNDTITKSGNATNDETQAKKELFSWTDVLHSIQSNAEKAAHRHSQLVEVHQDLPSLHLSDSVVQRTTRRLRALYEGQTDAHLLRSVPSVFDYDKIHHNVSSSIVTKLAQEMSDVPTNSEKSSKHKKKRKLEMIEDASLAISTTLAKEKVSKTRENAGGKLNVPVVPIAVWETRVIECSQLTL